jgi:hypothetical protein
MPLSIDGLEQEPMFAAVNTVHFAGFVFGRGDKISQERHMTLSTGVRDVLQATTNKKSD